MPLYTVVTQEDSLSTATKTKIAEEITRIHSTVMNVPKNFVRVVFLSYPAGSGYTAGTAAATAAVNCILRNGHGVTEKADMLRQLWSMLQT
jgi:phenylpyruvate tautomerase PptA (4-oxalocrotonate tautomerase family)